MTVSTGLLRSSESAIAAAYVEGLGCAEDAFQTGRLTVVDRPDDHWGYLASAVSFASGTVLAVAPELADVARDHAPEVHRQALSLPFLARLASAAVRDDGRPASVEPAAICWGLSAVPPPPPFPDDLTLEVVDAERLNELIGSGLFENGAGASDGSDGRRFRNLHGVALVDEHGDIAALAGVFSTYGLHEIGVDVVPARQGQGLGQAIVSAAVRRILDLGAVPFYGCSANNIRSQRTALASGFLPVCADATVA